MKIPVGFNVLEAVLAPLCEPQEPVYSKLSGVIGSDEHQMRDVIREFVKPYYDSFDDRSRKIIAGTIIYFTFKGQESKGVTLDSLPTPFDLPQDINKLCLWLLKELEIDETGFNLEEFEYSDDLSLVHRLRRNRI